MQLAGKTARSSAMIRSSCTLLAVVGLFLQGSHGGHMLLVEHTRCDVHGELVHGGGEAHHTPAASNTTTDFPAFERAPDHRDGCTHEHCSHASERRNAVAEAPSTLQVAQRSVELVASTPSACALDARTPLYRTAPKTSPPA